MLSLLRTKFSCAPIRGTIGDSAASLGKVLLSRLGGLFSLILLLLAQAVIAGAASLDWGTIANGTNLLTSTATSTVSGVTITTHAVQSGTFETTPVVAAGSAGSNGSAAGVINLSMNATLDNETSFTTTTITFSEPVVNLSFTVRDIDGGPAANTWDDRVDFNSSAGVPSSGTPASGVGYTAGTGRAFASADFGITDTTGNVTVTWAVPVTFITIKYIAGPTTTVARNPDFQLLVLDDLTFDLMPTLAVNKTSMGGVGAFNFSTSNSGSGNTTTTVTTTIAGTAVQGPATRLLALNTTTTLTETGPAGWSINPATAPCTDSNSASSGNPASFAASVSAQVVTVAADNIKPNAVIDCSVTNASTTPPDATLSILKTASTPGPFSVGQTVTYLYKVTNTGTVGMTGITIGDVHNGTGLFVAPHNETLSNDAAPIGDTTDVTANNGTWSAIGPGDSVTFTATYVVTQHDVDFLQ